MSRQRKRGAVIGRLLVLLAWGVMGALLQADPGHAISIAESILAADGASLADRIRDPSDNAHINAWLFSEVLLKTHRPDSGGVISQRNEVNIQFDYKLNEYVKLYTWIRPFYDSVYDWNGGTSASREARSLRNTWGDNFTMGNDKDPIFRELYVDFRYGDFLGRAGRQIVAWGKSDGVFLLDNINPFNYREPLRFEEQETKIPQWMLNLNYRFGTVGTFQVLWIPDPEFATFYGDNARGADGGPNCAHPFTFNVVCMTNEVFVVFDEFFKSEGIVGADGQVGFPFPVRKKPANTIENSDVMVRFDSSIGGLTYSLAYEYKWAWFLVDFPDVGDRRGTPGEGKAIQAIGNIRRAQRIHIVGGAVDYQFAWLPLLGERTVGRMETGIFIDDAFFLPNFDVVLKDHHQVLIGLDKFILDPPWLDFPALGIGPGTVPWFFSVQFFQDVIIDPEDWHDAYITGGSRTFDFETGQTTDGLRDAVQHYITLFLGKDILPDQSLNVEQFLLIDPQFGDVWEHIRLKYLLTDFVTLAVGYNKTWGGLDGPFGSNRASDYVWTQLFVGI